MITLETRVPNRNTAARLAMESEAHRPLFKCGWERVVMVHYAVDPEVLQPFVPFELDTYDGKAWVSFVAFTLSDMRLGIGGPAFATHGFLNVRTYVKAAGEKSIFFLAEWLPNPLCVFLGPRLYGLPYRWGRLDYRHDHEHGTLEGSVKGKGSALTYRAEIDPEARFETSPEGSLNEFLMERYVAFTRRGLTVRRFRVWHPTWKHAPIDLTLDDESILASTGDWFKSARRSHATYSPGFKEAWMGRPTTCPSEVIE